MAATSQEGGRTAQKRRTYLAAECAAGGDLVVRRYGALQAVAWWVDATAERG